MASRPLHDGRSQHAVVLLLRFAVTLSRGMRTDAVRIREIAVRDVGTAVHPLSALMRFGSFGGPVMSGDFDGGFQMHGQLSRAEQSIDGQYQRRYLWLFE